MSTIYIACRCYTAITTSYVCFQYFLFVFIKIDFPLIGFLLHEKCENYLLYVLNSVDSWAEEFGKELYEMAQTMTKVKEIKDVSIFSVDQFI